MNSHDSHTVPVYSQINKILVEWNPLSVVGPAVQDEYSGFVPEIASAIRTHRDLNPVLRRMFIALGLEMSDAELNSEIKLLCERLKMLEIV